MIILIFIILKVGCSLSFSLLDQLFILYSIIDFLQSLILMTIEVIKRC
jgi:hypothetical protein